MDLRQIILDLATRGVRVGDSTARITDIQLREGAPPYVRVPAGYVIVDDITVTREMLAQFFAWMHPSPRRGAPDPGLAPAWQVALDADPRQSIVRACTLESAIRLRATLFRHGEADADGQHALAASIRVLPLAVPSMERLGLHSFLREWIRCSGLVLVTGATGMGKSTTIAALLNYVNTDPRFGSRNIITLEGPIEYRLSSQLSIMTQREVGEGSVRDFEAGIEAALRQRPDILMIGEILTRDAAAAALRAALSGHTVVATVHGDSAVGALQSLLGLFPPDEVGTRAKELARALVGVTYQRLAPSLDETRPVLAAEQLTNTEPSRRLIETLKFQELDNDMKARSGKSMWTLEADLANLVKRRQVSAEWARALANDPDHLERLLRAAHVPSSAGTAAGSPNRGVAPSGAGSDAPHDT
ncbi:MAG TPA: ATPase, T2SS/T4P/T4SS family [Burkholderiaceae bacterium]|nr:ATPase, T2SS/T4P/T4SS family [Burkholderiaceae bacterium]